MKTFIAIWETTGALVIVYQTPLCSMVEFESGFQYFMAELGGVNKFHLIGEL